RRRSSAPQSLPPRAPSTPRSGCSGRHRQVRSCWPRTCSPKPRPSGGETDLLLKIWPLGGEQKGSVMLQTADNGAAARRLMRRQTHAALATRLADGSGGHPYASLVAVAFDLDASPLLLLSDLAQHTRNVASDPRVSLLFASTGADHLRPAPTSGEDPLAAPRLSLVGEAARTDDPALLARFT